MVCSYKQFIFLTDVGFLTIKGFQTLQPGKEVTGGDVLLTIPKTKHCWWQGDQRLWMRIHFHRQVGHT
jgi:hypothetical protein